MQTEVKDEMTGTPFAGTTVGPCVIETFTNTEASAEIPFGTMIQDDGDHEALKLSGATPVLGGITVFEYLGTDDLGTTGVKAGKPIGVLRKGQVWVNVEDGCAPGDEVHVRHTVSGGGDPVGNFLSNSSGDANKSLDISKFAQWRSTVSGAGLALLEIDMVGASQYSADT